MRFSFAKPTSRRPSPALVVSIIALIVAVGGGSFAIAASDNKKDKKIANTVVTTRAPTLSVSSATNATNATNLAGFVPFHGTATEHTSVKLAGNGQFDVIGWCDSGNSLKNPNDTSGGAYVGTQMSVVERGQNGGTLQSDDSSIQNASIGAGIGYSYYSDGGDSASAMNPNGHYVDVPSATEADSVHTPGFSGCMFSGIAYFG